MGEMMIKFFKKNLLIMSSKIVQQMQDNCLTKLDIKKILAPHQFLLKFKNRSTKVHAKYISAGSSKFFFGISS
jgi:hypothetical protein